MRTLFIIGASSGIGEALARHSASQGVSLALFARPKSLTTLTRQAQELGKQYGIATAATALDMTDPPQAVLTAMQKASQSVGKPDCIWINGGVLLPETDKAWHDLANEKATFATNTLGAIACIRAAQRLFDGQGGHIAITASTAGFLPFADYPAYAASKSAIRQYANSIRGQLRRENIALTLLYFGFVRTEMTASYEHKYPEFLFCDVEQLIPPLFSALKHKKKSAVLPTMPWLPIAWFGKWFL